MGFIDHTLSYFGYSKGTPIMQDQFMLFTGSCEVPGFCVDFDCLSGLKEAYCHCSPISSIIGKLASAMANGKWWVVDENDSDVSHLYPAISKLLDSPNPLQTWTEFCIQADTLRYIYGEVFLYFSIPVGFTPQDATAVWAINPECIEIAQTGRMYDQSSFEAIVKHYVFNDGVKSRIIHPDSVLHIKDSHQNISFNSKSLRGCSRLISLENDIKNFIFGQEAIRSLNKDRGAQGMITNKTKDSVGDVALNKEEIEQVHKDYNQAFGLDHSKKKVFISNKNLDWKQMSFNVKDLMLHEGLKQNKENMADAFNYPYALLANSTGPTYSNQDTSDKDLYQNAVIPFSKIYAEKFTKYFGLAGAKIIIDFSDVECLQEAKKEKAEAMKSLNAANEIAFQNHVITVEEWREDLEKDQNFKGNTFYNGNKETPTNTEGD